MTFMCLFQAPQLPMTATQITVAITAVGALGTSAFGLVDASKFLRKGLPSRGLKYISGLVHTFIPPAEDAAKSVELSATAIVGTLCSNWISGNDLDAQKSTAKTLIKLRMSPDIAPHLAELTGVDSAVLTSVATKLTNGEAMTPQEMDTYGRFDILLSSAIDRAYLQADQAYTSTAKLCACGVAILLAEVAAYSLGWFPLTVHLSGIQWQNFFMAFLVGLVATPLAPIAKDIATAINNASTAVQSIKS